MRDTKNRQLNLEVSWEGTYTIESTGATLEIDFSVMDFDIYVYDETLNDTGIYDGATGANPETIALSGLDDGVYYIVEDLYDNPLSDYEAEQTVPLTLSWSQDYFENVVGSITLNDFTTDSTSGTLILATVTIQDGYIFTVN